MGIEAASGGCCFEVGFGDMMKPCCLKTREVTSLASCPAAKREDGKTGFTSGACPATAEAANQMLEKPVQLAQTLPVLHLNAQGLSEKELRAWRMQQLVQIDNSVPKGYRQAARESVESEYATRLADLQAPTLMA